MTHPLETLRLLLRPLELADAEQTQIIFPHWEIVRYLADTVPWPYPADGAYRYYSDDALPAIERGEAWMWSLRLKTNPREMIGIVTLMKNETNNRGFWIGQQWQGQGLITEACDAITDYWFNVLNFPVLRVPKAIANTASRRISERQAMRVIGTEERGYVSGVLPSEIWEITAGEWNARKRAK
jgi:[ribosomal protein S5]-alanine N-acetyltransferase